MSNLTWTELNVMRIVFCFNLFADRVRFMWTSAFNVTWIISAKTCYENVLKDNSRIKKPYFQVEVHIHSLLVFLLRSWSTYFYWFFHHDCARGERVIHLTHLLVFLLVFFLPLLLWCEVNWLYCCPFPVSCFNQTPLHCTLVCLHHIAISKQLNN